MGAAAAKAKGFVQKAKGVVAKAKTFANTARGYIDKAKNVVNNVKQYVPQLKQGFTNTFNAVKSGDFKGAMNYGKAMWGTGMKAYQTTRSGWQTNNWNQDQGQDDGQGGQGGDDQGGYGQQKGWGGWGQQQQQQGGYDQGGQDDQGQGQGGYDQGGYGQQGGYDQGGQQGGYDQGGQQGGYDQGGQGGYDQGGQGGYDQGGYGQQGGYGGGRWQLDDKIASVDISQLVSKYIAAEADDVLADGPDAASDVAAVEPYSAAGAEVEGFAADAEGDADAHIDSQDAEGDLHKIHHAYGAEAAVAIL